jgi:quercetin dioxygenase-like cupin family protein
MIAANWDEIPDEEARPGIRRRGFGNDDCLLVYNECRPGMALRPHSHDFDQIAMITRGRAVFHVGDAGHEVGPGSVLLIRAGEEHYIEPVGDETVHNIDVFVPLREDYRHLVAWMDDAAEDGTLAG